MYYSKEVIKKMYLKEGKSPEEAEILASRIHKELNTLDAAERRLWKKVRAHEVVFSDLSYS